MVTETATYSGCGFPPAPLTHRWALGVHGGWRHGTASEVVIPAGWQLLEGTILCYAHGKCPHGNPYGNRGALPWKFTCIRTKKSENVPTLRKYTSASRELASSLLQVQQTRSVLVPSDVALVDRIIRED